MFKLEAIDHVGLLVRDMDRAIRWYQDVFGMERRHQEVWTGNRDPVVMAMGDVQIALFSPAGGTDIREFDVNEHFAMRVDRVNFDRARRELRARGVPFKEWDHKICVSVYLFDTEGNQIEITTYRPAPRKRSPRR